MLYPLICAIVLWVCSVVCSAALGRMKYKSNRLLTPTYILVAGTFLAAALIFSPIYFADFAADFMPIRIFKTAVISIHHAVRLFVVDSDFEIINLAAASMDAVLAGVFSTFAAVLFIFAPILTCNFFLSFFKNLSSYKRYLRGFFSDAYVFSELNEKSLSLAKSIKENTGAVIVFTDVFKKNEEKSFEAIESAKEIGAILFKKDVLSVNFKLHSKRKKLVFFAIGEDEPENIKQSIGIIKGYKKREGTMLYTFSTTSYSELIFSANDEGMRGMVKVHRINDARSLVYRTLFDMEAAAIAEHAAANEKKHDLFDNAYIAPDGVREINAVVVGCGLHGTEMIKALSWFCQMDGYRVSINAFDKEENTEKRYKALMPELMSEEYNGIYVEGEAHYSIKVHPGADIETSDFADEIRKLSDTTYVFVALGTDEANIKGAVILRTLFEQMGIKPIIHAVVYSTEKRAALTGATNFKGEGYKIDFVGDLEHLYSERVIIDSELEDDAKRRHLAYTYGYIEAEEAKRGTPLSPEEKQEIIDKGEADFWAYEYNYRSSMASALHHYARIACGIPGADKPDSELTQDEEKIIVSLEHRRWNAYMRSEGYIGAEVRNDLGKMHSLLVNFKILPEGEKIKDIRRGR